MRNLSPIWTAVKAELWLPLTTLRRWSTNNKVDAAKAAGPLKLALRKALAAGTIIKAKEVGSGNEKLTIPIIGLFR